MSQMEYAKVLQIIVAIWGLFGLALLFAADRVLANVSGRRLSFSGGTVLFFRLAGAASAFGACYRLFFWHG